MTHREYDPAPDDQLPHHRPAGGGGGSPGKRSLTQGLMPRPVIYRVESGAGGAGAGPRDGNGVAAGADAAVTRAASGSGAGLRADVRERFEGSLGANLSSVRVHTGAESADAATAVGARAYTVGNDIHFGAGQYQPDNPFGLHLLAHEVAHTRQQAGGTPHRQNKLEVSTPGDVAEREADRAADAMIAGQAATVGSATGLARDAASVASFSKSFKKGPVEIEIAGSTDGKVSISGSIQASQGIETGIPFVFCNLSASGKVTGEGQLNPDGSASIAVAAELSGQGTINGGIQKVASIYGGLAVALKLPGVTVTRSAAGAWDVKLGKTISLTGKLVVGAAAEITDALPPPWQGLKYEVNPLGEKELAVLDVTTGKLSMGKDVRAALASVKSALVSAGLMDAPVVTANKGAAAAIEAAKAHARKEKKRLDAEKAARVKKEAADSSAYDQAHNPARADNSHADNAAEDMNECNEDNYTESTNQP